MRTHLLNTVFTCKTPGHVSNLKPAVTAYRMENCRAQSPNKAKNIPATPTTPGAPARHSQLPYKVAEWVQEADWCVGVS